ncbi:hypothetical protein H4R99_008761 [Coemansia sp. RSA 1722]|nr:hypothetical protein LPJ57_011173 [Coemansia sp. RSA 486]KAJ2585229.1 hypothetical protein H4R99_008761 [Coemansia sp. RSA 1722]
MFVRISAAALICTALGLTASAQPVGTADQVQHHHAMVRRSPWNGGFGGSGFWPCGCNGFFPFASSNVNAFNQNAFASNFNDDTLFKNHKNANTAANNVNAFNSANVIA